MLGSVCLDDWISRGVHVQEYMSRRNCPGVYIPKTGWSELDIQECMFRRTDQKCVFRIYVCSVGIRSDDCMVRTEHSGLNIQDCMFRLISSRMYVQASACSERVYASTCMKMLMVLLETALCASLIGPDPYSSAHDKICATTDEEIYA